MSKGIQVTIFTEEVMPTVNWVALDDFLKMKRATDKRIKELEELVQLRGERMELLFGCVDSSLDDWFSEILKWFDDDGKIVNDN